LTQLPRMSSNPTAICFQDTPEISLREIRALNSEFVIPKPRRTTSLSFELDRLFERINYERTIPPSRNRGFKLEMMRSLLHELGNPQDRYQIVHVAGTKGKGTVCRLIASGLTESGLPTGRYSSPHIDSLNERIEINGQLISDEDLADVLHEVRTAAEAIAARGNPSNSFFEVITAAGLLHFARQGAVYVVLEVGLGGRLDSTNVCHPCLSVITNISFDHTRQLGDSLDKIAFEKAGIVKQRVPVISGTREPAAAEVIRQVCAARQSPLLEIDRDFTCRIEKMELRHFMMELFVSGDLADFRETPRDGCSYELSGVAVRGAAGHVADNAAIAVAALMSLSLFEPRIGPDSIRRGLKVPGLPARMEMVCQEPMVIFDMSHNVASTQALVETLQHLATARQPRRRRLILSISRDKDAAGILRRLLPEFDEVVFTRYLLNPRAASPADLWAIGVGICGQPEAGEHGRQRWQIAETPADAWEMAVREIDGRDLLCVCGSAFLVPEIREAMKQKPLPGRETPGLGDLSRPATEHGCN
jgi:dihydrofolate synthase / folylpolyglutamate synthase